MKKVKMKIVALKEEPKKNGGMHLRVTAKSEEKLYTFGVKEEDYMNEYTRERFHQNWLKQIKKAQAMAQRPKATIKKDKEKVQALIGTEVDESEY